MTGVVDLWDAEKYDRNASFVPNLGNVILDMFSPKEGERVLDLGCGDGKLTQKIKEAGCTVVGIDQSPSMVEAAHSRGLNAIEMDALEMAFESEFDAVFSNAVLHWILNHKRLVTNVWRALRSGGRFVGEFGGEGNTAAIKAALEAGLRKRGVESKPHWIYPSAAQWQSLLEQAGFDVESCFCVPRPTPLINGMSAWLETFAEAFAQQLPTAQRSEYLAEVEQELRSSLLVDGKWTADYVRLRFIAHKPKGDSR